jgi:hypothetical protein
MASPIEFKLILAQAAQADSANGTLHMLGAGWSVTPTPTAPQAVALLIKIPWDRANEKLPLALELLTADGQPVTLPGPAGPQRVGASAELEVGRPPGVAHGSMLDASFALNVSPMPLAPADTSGAPRSPGRSRLSHSKLGTYRRPLLRHPRRRRMRLDRVPRGLRLGVRSGYRTTRK